ncbi:MAG TPA: SpoIIE family protein phosphatase [Spirochaetota bacterium]|nr:SpoIIE family protein phosphatase [Spirochaetota bacterium]HOS39431.1 SpoIIE family protein phosphatase [Spirochaetota bacterium]HPU87614.1 SpoIIE family protein phosphatase [Spirochaetota bacterium]
MNLDHAIISNKYRITGMIGEGGISEVYRAVDIISGNDRIALKVLKKNRTTSRIEDVIRFQGEAAIASHLTHPHIVSVFDVGSLSGLHYLCMEFIDGMSLAELLRNGSTFTPAEAVDIVAQVARALEHIHRSKIIHRDLKPGNIMISRDGPDGAPIARIIDFGLAQIKEFGAITDPDEIAGTFSYMSPEQSGVIKRPVDERSDLYSLGIIFYQLLTRALPYEGDSITALLHQHVAAVPRPPVSLNPDLPRVLDRIVLKLIEKEPANRYQGAEGLLRDLEAYRRGETDFTVGQQDAHVKLDFRTALVGREREMARLSARLDSMLQGNGGVCLIGGGAGSGKTRIAEEVMDRFAQRQGIVIGGKCFSGDAKTPYGPLRDALGALVKQYGKLSPHRQAALREQLRGSTGELGAVIESLNPLVREILGESQPLIALEPERENRRFLTVAARFFLALGAIDGGLILFLDDLQWADTGTFAVLSEIAQEIASRPVLVLGTYRDNEISASHPLRALTKSAQDNHQPLDHVPLGNFDSETLNRFVASLLHMPPDDTREIHAHVQRQSGGNPFFAIEIIKRMIDDGSIAFREMRWVLVPEQIAHTRIAASIIEIILQRITQLTSRDMTILSYAALIGHTFDMDLLFRLLPADGTAEIVSAIDRAIELRLLEEDSIVKGVVHFVHDRIREACTERIASDERRRIHLEIARILEGDRADERDERIFELAHHVIEGGDDEKTLAYAVPAGEMAKDEYANAEAIRYFTIARDILERRGRTGDERWRLCVTRIGELLILTGQHDAAIEQLTGLLEHQHAIPEKALTNRLLADAFFKKGDLARCEIYAHDGLALLGERLPLGVTAVVAGIIKELGIRALHRALPLIFVRKSENPRGNSYRQMLPFFKTLGWNYSLSDTKKYARLIMRVLNLCERRLGPSKELGTALMGYAGIFMFAAWFDTALALHRKAVALARRSNDLWGTAQTLQLTAYCHKWKGEYPAALTLFGESLRIFREIGDIREVGITNAGIGETHLYLGDYAAAKQANDDFMKISRKTRDHYGVSAALMCSMPYHIQRGELHRAYENGSESYAIAQERDLPFVLCETSMYLGVLALEQSDTDQAIKYLEQARTLYEKNSFLKHYTVFLYPYLVEARLAEFTRQRDTLAPSQRNAALRRIRTLCDQSLRITKSWATHHGLALRAAGRFWDTAGKPARAERFLLMSIEHHKRLGRTYELGRSLYEYALHLNRHGAAAASRSQMESAHRIFREIAADDYRKRAAGFLGISQDDTGADQRLMDRQRIDAIIKLSQDVSSILNLDSLLEIIMAKAVEVTGAQRGYLFIHDPDTHALTLKASRGLGDAGAIEYSHTVVDTVFHNARALITANARADNRLNTYHSVVTRGLKSILCVPLLHHTNVIGVCYLDNPLLSGVFTEEDADMLDVFMGQAAIAIENASLYNNLEREVELRTRELRQRTREVESKSDELELAYVKLNSAYSRMKEDLILAKNIQDNMLPPRVSRSGSLNIFVEYLPLIEVGGDLYDVFERADGSVRILIADATGHGIVAALFTMLIKSEYEKLKDVIDDPSELFERLNTIFFVSYKPLKMFFTGFLADINPMKSTIRYSSSGHPSQYLIRDGELIELPNTGRPVAIWDEALCETRHEEFRPGDRLLLFTDGLFEEFNRAKEQFGESRLRDLIKQNAHRDARELVTSLVRDLMRYIDSAELNDDITIIGIE